MSAISKLPEVKIHGRFTNQWTALSETGEIYPVFHHKFLVSERTETGFKQTYIDPHWGDKTEDNVTRRNKLLKALEETGRAVLQPNVGQTRKSSGGYIGLYKVNDFKIENGTLSFSAVKIATVKTLEARSTG